MALSVTRPPFLLAPEPESPFPPAHLALREPDGLLAVGGDLSPGRLLNAYRHGIFPWYARGQPILWWSPDPRMVFRSDDFGLPSRFRRSLKASRWILRADTAFDTVVRACAAIPRPGQRDTWILPAMARAYGELHRLGHAHSVEVFDGEELVGGIYAVAIGRMVYGESMFSARPGGSKLALAGLLAFMRERGWPLLDAQLENPHLLSLGGQRMARDSFLSQVAALAGSAAPAGPWREAFGTRPAAAFSVPALARFCEESPPVA
jgi:leucyl/phenylalanyl-tRNA--protein transferase